MASGRTWKYWGPSHHRCDVWYCDCSCSELLFPGHQLTPPQCHLQKERGNNIKFQYLALLYRVAWCNEGCFQWHWEARPQHSTWLLERTVQPAAMLHLGEERQFPSKSAYWRGEGWRSTISQSWTYQLFIVLFKSNHCQMLHCYLHVRVNKHIVYIIQMHSSPIIFVWIEYLFIQSHCPVVKIK